MAESCGFVGDERRAASMEFVVALSSLSSSLSSFVVVVVVVVVWVVCAF